MAGQGRRWLFWHRIERYLDATYRAQLGLVPVSYLHERRAKLLQAAQGVGWRLTIKREQ